MIAGFYRGVNFFALLGCYAAYVGDVTDVSGQHIGSFFIGQTVLTVNDGTDGLPRNVRTNYQCTLRNIREERRSHLNKASNINPLALELDI